MEPKKSELWKPFEVYARTNGIDLEHEDDWLPWWKCYFTGAAEGYKGGYEDGYSEAEYHRDVDDQCNSLF